MKDIPKELYPINPKFIPLWDFQLGKLTVFIWKNFQFNLEPLDTEPYLPKGEVPITFIQIGFVEFCINSKGLYNFFSKFI